MKHIVNISGSVSLALHSLAYLARNSNRIIATKNIAKSIGASEAHLHKVMKLLVKADILLSVRGPKGGFRLRKPADDITLLEILEVIEGRVTLENCVMDMPGCNGNQCIFGDLLSDMNNYFMKYVRGTTLAQVSDVFPEETPVTGH